MLVKAIAKSELMWEHFYPPNSIFDIFPYSTLHTLYVPSVSTVLAFGGPQKAKYLFLDKSETTSG